MSASLNSHLKKVGEEEEEEVPVKKKKKKALCSVQNISV